MKRLGRRAAILITGVGALVAAGSATALGAWGVPATRVQVTAKSGDVPTGPTPKAERAAIGIKVSWSPVTLDGATVSGYRVVRYTAGHPDQTDPQRCAVGPVIECVDTEVKAGETYTYTVRAVRGTWLGKESARSDAVTIASAAQTPGVRTSGSATQGGTISRPVTPSATQLAPESPAKAQTDAPTQAPTQYSPTSDPTTEPPSPSTSDQPGDGQPSQAQPSDGRSSAG